jgi:hypothetical protein
MYYAYFVKTDNADIIVRISTTGWKRFMEVPILRKTRWLYYIAPGFAGFRQSPSWG